MKQAISLLLAVALALSLGLVSGLPAAASSATWYVVEGGAGDRTGQSWGHAFADIQAGINASAPGDTVAVAAGTYLEQLIIETSLTLKGFDRPTVDFSGFTGSTNEITDEQSTHNEVAGIYVNTPDVVIEGFRFLGLTHEVAGLNTAIRVYSYGDDLTVDDNIFDPCTTTGNARVAITVKWADRLQFTGNLVTDYAVGVQLVDAGNPINDVLVQGNTFNQGTFIPDSPAGRDTCQGVQLWLGNNLVVRDNIFVGPGADPGENQPNIPGIIDFSGAFGSPGYSSTFEDNTIEGYYTGLGTTARATITGNTISDCERGVVVNTPAAYMAGTVINFNSIFDNNLGLSNPIGEAVNARYNWWGHQTGPDHDGLNLGGQGDSVSDDVHIGPWLYRPHDQFVSGAPCYAGSVLLASEAELIMAHNVTSYQGGWNSFSTPFALDNSANTVSKLLALTEGSGLFIERAQRYDVAEQKWVAVIMGNQLVGPDDYTIRPGEGFFLQVRSAGSIPILVRTDLTEPTTRSLVSGWNLIGLSSRQAQSVATALSGVDYSFVLSTKPPNDESWLVPPDGAGDTFLQVGEAYWVAMSQPGPLFITTTTPVADDMTWDLNQ